MNAVDRNATASTSPHTGDSPHGAEQQVRGAEAAQVTAVLARDEPALRKLWSPDLVVNAPNNSVSSAEGTFAAMRAGIVHYLAYDQTIEAVRVFGDTVIVLGEERVKPVSGPDAGNTVQRRFLDVWQQAGDRWLQIARQASAVSSA